MVAPRLATLVIGYGNTLRRDDGVGPTAAAIVAEWALPNVVATAVHQLGPELAGSLNAARHAFFIDARLGALDEPYQVQPIEPGIASSSLGHTSDPRALLALTRAVFGRCPEAWLITVPVVDLGVGDGLSRPVRCQLSKLIDQLSSLLGRTTDSRDQSAPSRGSRCTRLA